MTADHDLAPRLLDTPADDPDCVPGQICSTHSMSVLITTSTLAALGGSRAGRTRGSVRIFPCRSITTALARRTQQRPPPAAPRAAASPPPTPTSSSSSSSPSSTSSSSRASPSAAVIRNVLYTKISTSVVWWGGQDSSPELNIPKLKLKYWNIEIFWCFCSKYQ